MQPRDDQPARLPRPWGRVSTIRLETFSDGVFAIAVTLLALQLHPPNLGEATTAGAVLHALGQQARPFGFYTLAFLLTGRLWIEHHQLLDPLEAHGRHLAGTNLWFLFTVSLLPYWVSVMATYPHNSAAGGLFVLWMGVAQLAFVLVCLLVRRELGGGPAIDALVVPKVIRAANAAVLLAALGVALIAQVEVADPVLFAWLALLVVGGRSAVRVWSTRHRRRNSDNQTNEPGH
jgi:uncharacterized membrane protein